MQFDSFLFLIFFIIVVALYYVIPSWNLQKVLLLVCSYLFYASWSPPLVFLIWISTLVDYFIARRIHQTRHLVTRKSLLLLSLGVNLGLLGYFKYAHFLLHSFSNLIGSIGLSFDAPDMDIILPIGISFYTFQTISYTIDIYRNKLKPTNSILDFALYVTFFPQLVAGPIIRAGHFLPQCLQPRRANLDVFIWGVSLFLIGLFSKLVIADGILAPVTDLVFNDPGKFGWFDSWTAVFAFSAQIYFDFSGYSLCALGTAMCLGFHLPDNFNSPYAAIGFSDFWNRWHISLSSWMRDYLYIPLGGNRKQPARTFVNLFLTMFLAGLWHGASWTFVIWGWIHALFLILEHAIRQKTNHIPAPRLLRIFLTMGTFIVVSIAWIPFRSQNFDDLILMVSALFSQGFTNTIPVTSSSLIFAVVTFMLAGQIWSRELTFAEAISRMSPISRTLALSIVLLSILLTSTGDSRAFIYFQF